MSWSREQVEILLEEYKKHPCLYAVKSKEYKNKHSRTRALEDIEKVLRVVKPSVTVNDIKAKFHGLKTNFLTEHRKHVQSMKTGTAEDDIYQPTIWYYDLMFFILDHCVPRKATDNISSCNDVTPSTSSTPSEVMVEDLDGTLECEFVEEMQNEHVGLDTYLDVLPSTSPKPVPSTSDHQSPAPIRKRKRTDGADRIMEEATGALTAMSNALRQKAEKTAKTKNRFDIFGAFVASKLQQIHPDIVDDVEEEIINILFKGVRDSKNK